MGARLRVERITRHLGPSPSNLTPAPGSAPVTNWSRRQTTLLRMEPRQPTELSRSLSGRPTVPESELQRIRDLHGDDPSARIVLRPAIPEWQEHGGDYEEFIDASAASGIDIELAEIKGIPSGSDLPQFVPLAFAIYLGVRASDHVVGTITDLVMRVVVDRAQARWWRKGQKVKGVIYGPTGEILKEIEWVSTEGRSPHDADL